VPTVATPEPTPSTPVLQEEDTASPPPDVVMEEAGAIETRTLRPSSHQPDSTIPITGTTVETVDDASPLIDTLTASRDDKGEFLFQSLYLGMGTPVLLFPLRH